MGLLLSAESPPPPMPDITNLAYLTTPPDTGFYLNWDGVALALCRTGDQQPLLRVDFTSQRETRRRRRASPGGEQLARACGIRHGESPQVLDATGGLGRDAFLLAALGARVQVLERSSAIAALLADGLRRAKETTATATIARRLTLTHGDAQALLQPDMVDTVYLDPMYQKPGRKALAGKEMQLLQALLGTQHDADELLAPALAAARRRVVVKRHRHAPPLAGQTPNHQYHGRSTRFDIYRPWAY